MQIFVIFILYSNYSSNTFRFFSFRALFKQHSALKAAERESERCLINLNSISLKPFAILTRSVIIPCGFLFFISGKGDLVGCDISLNLMHNGLGGGSGGGGQGGQDFILKSSSDVKVGQSVLLKSANMDCWVD